MDTALERLAIAPNEGPKTQENKDSDLSDSHLAPVAPQNASLDGLPAELKLSIFRAVPNIQTLRALVWASPAYHIVYLDGRKSILSEVLMRDIGSCVLQDALAVHAASRLGFPKGSGETKLDLEPLDDRYTVRREIGGRKDSVISFLGNYKIKRNSTSSLATEYLDLETAALMSRLHLTVSRVASDFCETALDSLASDLTKSETTQSKELSTNEQRRIYRALYRFELYRVLFNTSSGNFSPDNEPGFDQMDGSFLFLHLFEAWEIEELACIHDYMFHRQGRIFQSCIPELSERLPSKNFTEKRWNWENIGHLEFLGFSFLCRFLDASSPAQQASVLESHISYGNGYFEDILKEDPYEVVYETDVYTASQEEEGVELVFEGDSRVSGPNAAWPWSTNQKVYLFYFDKCMVAARKWACVMWDYDRLKDWGVLDRDPTEFQVQRDENDCSICSLYQ